MILECSFVSDFEFGIYKYLFWRNEWKGDLVPFLIGDMQLTKITLNEKSIKIKPDLKFESYPVLEEGSIVTSNSSRSYSIEIFS